MGKPAMQRDSPFIQSSEKRLSGKTVRRIDQSPFGRLLRAPRTLAVNTLNTFVYVLSLGTYVLHHGRFLGSVRKWVNWNQVISCQPKAYWRPRNEQELRQCLLDSQPARVRIVGSGHSFNASPATNEFQVSLERYKLDTDEWLEWTNKERGIVRVSAGMKLRDLTRTMWKQGWTLPVLGSTDAQSIAGLLATDVHGTGRTHGFLSEQILCLKLMDAQGNVRTFRRESGAEEYETFRAAIGGLGACGVLLEVELQGVPAFNLEKTSWLMQRSWVDRHLADILREHEHVSFYELGGINAEHVRMNVWKPTGRAPSALLRMRRITSEVLDILVSGFLLELASTWASKRKLVSDVALFAFKLLMDGKHSVHPAPLGFTRMLYFQHDELEYGVPYENYHRCIDELRQLLVDEKFVSLIEVRFTPPNRSPALLGPGAGDRQICFIELAPTLSYGRRRLDDVFTKATKIFQRYGGRAHLGKQMPEVDVDRMKKMHGQRFVQFQRARDRQDPLRLERRFTNEFTQNVLGR